MAQLPTLPQELLDHIIDIAVATFSKNDLAACSLVGWSLLDRTRKDLYHHIVLSSTLSVEKLNQLIDILAEDPSLTKARKEEGHTSLASCIRSFDYLIAADDIHPNNKTALEKLLAHLLWVEEFGLDYHRYFDSECYMGFSPRHNELYDALLRFCTKVPLKSLSVAHIHILPFEIFVNCPRLASVKLKNTRGRWKAENLELPRPHAPPTIRTLSVDARSISFIATSAGNPHIAKIYSNVEEFSTNFVGQMPDSMCHLLTATTSLRSLRIEGPLNFSDSVLCTADSLMYMYISAPHFEGLHGGPVSLLNLDLGALPSLNELRCRQWLFPSHRYFFEPLWELLKQTTRPTSLETIDITYKLDISSELDPSSSVLHIVRSMLNYDGWKATERVLSGNLYPSLKKVRFSLVFLDWRDRTGVASGTLQGLERQVEVMLVETFATLYDRGILEAKCVTS